MRGRSGLVGVVELTPVLLLMVVAGNAADRYPRRNIGIFAHTLLTRRRDRAGAACRGSNGPTCGDLLAAASGRHRARVCVAVGQHDPAAAARARRSSPTPTRGCRRRFSWRRSPGRRSAALLIAATGARHAAVCAGGRRPADLHRACCARCRCACRRRPPARRSARDVFAGFRFVRAQPAVPVGDHARSVRRAVRRRRGAAADLREGHPRGRPGRARLAARRARRSAR